MIPDHDANSLSAPCAQWASLLAASALDLSSADRQALDRHVTGCAGCAATRADYSRMDSLIHRLPAPDPLPALPASLLATWRSGAAAEMVLDDSVAHDDLSELSEGKRMMRTTSTDVSTPPFPQAPRPRRRLAGWLGGTAAVAVVLLFALAFALMPHGGTGPGAGHQTGPATGPARATATMLPSGMRAAYLGQDGHLHYLALDSTHDTTGPALPDTAWIAQAGNDNGARAATSSDGSAIAYAGGTDPAASTEVVIVKVATGAITKVALPATGGQSLVHAANLFWSPDGRQIAVDPYFEGNTGPLSLIDVAHGTARQLNAGQVDRIAGWLDATHLAVIANFYANKATPAPQAGVPASGNIQAMPASGGPALEVDALDVTSSVLRHIVDLAVNAPPDVFVSPDGKLIYVAPSTWMGNSYVVDPVTGQTRDLPHISDTFSTEFTNIGNDGFARGGNWAVPMAWEPGTHIVAMSLGAWGPGPEGGPPVAVQTAGVWLLDLDHDAATLVNPGAYPLAWLANGGALLTSSIPPSNASFAAQNGGLMAGPVVSVLTPVTAHGGTKVLARNLVLFFGLVQAG